LKNNSFINKKSFAHKIIKEGFIMKIQDPDSKFVKIRCSKCKNEQIMFGKASTEVNCLVCGKQLAESSGGKSKIKARILEVLE
jgi:small subunit ribosomal protein S27e